jgi:cytochrome c
MKFLICTLHIAIFASLLLATVLAPSPLFAQEASEGASLVMEHRCYACHDMDKALIGPPYLAIAARHAGQKDVMEKVLATKIILGGGGNWGMVPMVPNEHVPEQDALVIARWILGLPPSR